MYRRIPTWNLGTCPFRKNPLWDHAIQIAVWAFSDVFVIGAVFAWGKRSLKRILSLQRFFKKRTIHETTMVHVKLLVRLATCRRSWVDSLTVLSSAPRVSKMQVGVGTGGARQGNMLFSVGR